jgi:hypothetical protein
MAWQHDLFIYEFNASHLYCYTAVAAAAAAGQEIKER